MKKIKLVFSATIFTLCLAVTAPSNAMNWFKSAGDNNFPAGNNNPNQNPNEPGTASVPIDGGILMLLIAGSLIGAKVVYDGTKKAVALKN